MQIANYELFVLSLRREVVYLQTARGDFGQCGDKASPRRSLHRALCYDLPLTGS